MRWMCGDITAATVCRIHRNNSIIKKKEKNPKCSVVQSDQERQEEERKGMRGWYFQSSDGL